MASLVPLLVLCSAVGAARHNAFETPEYLRQSQRDDLRAALKVTHNHNIAKNVVLMIGDGMGISTITASRIYVGQKLGKTGEEHKLSFETWPAVALSKTYNLDRQVADSAGTAVAFMTGVKVNMGTLGVVSAVPYGKDCSMVSETTKLQSVLDHALAAGKSVGIVTNTRVTHATPGACYAHVPLRDFENDADMADSTNCGHVKDIAYQLIMDNPGIHVIMGGGRRNFLPNTTSGGRRQDGVNLVNEWKKDKEGRGLKHAHVDTKGDMGQVNVRDTDYLLGLFSESHMAYEAHRNSSEAGEPSLEEMAELAVKILKKNPLGYFLLVEGGRIDHAHHDSKAHLSLAETEMFDKTVQTMDRITSTTDTLITVTADHSHVFTIAGYPSRGNPILAAVDTANEPFAGPPDGLPYLTLSYSNGPGGRANGSRVNYTHVDTEAVDFQSPADVNMPWETHGGEDVAIFSKGPMSHLFHSTHEQSYIAHVMMYAACIGDYGDDIDCDREVRLLKHEGMEGDHVNSGTQHGGTLFTLVAVFVCAAVLSYR